MASNENLQAQIDALREALGEIGGARVSDRNESAAKLTGPQLVVRAGSTYAEALRRFDQLRQSD